jgi:hypothetical protein
MITSFLLRIPSDSENLNNKPLQVAEIAIPPSKNPKTLNN